MLAFSLAFSCFPEICVRGGQRQWRPYGECSAAVDGDFFFFTPVQFYRGHVLSEQSLMDGDSLCRCRPDATALSIVVMVLKCQGKVPTAKPLSHSLPSSFQRGH